MLSEPSGPGVKRSVFITGASGYVGTRLLQRLDRSRYSKIVCLVRDPDALSANGNALQGVDLVVGDVGVPASYRDMLRHCDTVVHLAAVTGKAQPAEYFRVNSDGTRALVEAAKSQGVQNFLFVSTIAVKYAKQHRYFYAHSKKQAEDIVAAAGLSHTILRPTLVTGPGAPATEGLARMAKSGVVPVFGDGRVKVQPIFIDDLADSILSVLEEGRFRGETIELGGPQIMSIEELMVRIRRVRYGKSSRIVHLPLRAIQTLLGLLEPLFLPILPLTSGQLALFANDSTIAANAFVDDRSARMKDVEAGLALTSSETEGAEAELAFECRLYCRHLIGEDPNDYVQEKYALYHSRKDARTILAKDRFDSFLLRFSRMSRLTTGLVDAYTSVFHKHSVVRKKLVLLLAILECTPRYLPQLDSTDPGSRPWIFTKMAARAAGYGLSLVLATPPLATLHLIQLFVDSRRAEGS